jgi:succinate-acetate transporter protein
MSSDLEKVPHLSNGRHYEAQAPAHRQFANPAPLGLFSFASTTLILSFFNVHARGVTVPNAVVGMAIGVGGLCQLLAGMWEFAAGNTFGATAFSSYGGFWISYGIILWPSSGIIESYTAKPATASQLHNALGTYLMAWFIFTTIMFLATFRSNVSLCALFFFLALTFMMLMIGEFLEKPDVSKAGGGLGILTAAIAFYTAAHGVINPDSSYFGLPVGDLPKRA